MTIPAVSDVIRRTAEQLSRDFDINAGLNKVAREVEKADAPSESVKMARDKLRSRARSLKAAEDKLEQLRKAVSLISELLVYTPEGWPERQQQLDRELRAEPLSGIASWLSDWFTAASYCRFDALARLEQLDAIPPWAALLVEHCRAARRGLEHEDWHLAGPIVEAGANGTAIGGRTVPGEVVRADLRLLLVRLALAQSETNEAGEAIAAATAKGPSPALEALRARWLRDLGELESARAALERAADLDPADLDVAVELIGNARTIDQPQLAMEAARVAISGLPVLVDIEAELGRLLGSVPAELWAAVAERALAERDFDAHALALDHAMTLAPEGSTLRAIIAQLGARGAIQRKLPTEDQVEALLVAGYARIQVNQPELAAEQFETVLKLQPGHRDATLALADCLIVGSSDQPLVTAKRQVERALALIREVQDRGKITADTSWSYLSEAIGHQRLSDPVTEDGQRHAWLGLLAACRSVVHAPGDAKRWQEVASTAQTLSLFETGVAAAKYAADLDPADPTEYVRALTNAYHLDAALEWLGEPTDPYGRALKAYLLVRVGDFGQAVMLLRSATPDLNWVWASWTLVSALLLTGEHDEALAKASQLRSWWSDRLDETRGALATAWASVVLGDFETAERLRSSLDTQDALEIAAVIRLLSSDLDAGMAALRDCIQSATLPSQVEDVRAAVLPLVRALADRRGVSLPDQAPIEEEIARRRAELLPFSDPITELGHASFPQADAETVALAKAMCAALLHLARNDASAALAAIQDPLQSDPGDAELAALRDHLSARVSSPHPAPSGADETAADVRDAAAAAMRMVGEGVASKLEGFLDDKTAIEAELPPSWFEGHENPLADHPLFRRYIPAIREEATWTVPPVRVRTDEELEPDGYRLMLKDLTDEGRVSRGYRYATYEAFERLGLESVAETDVTMPDLARVPESTLADVGSFGELLTMEALEVVARRMSELAQRNVMRGKIRWPQRVAGVLSRALASTRAVDTSQ